MMFYSERSRQLDWMTNFRKNKWKSLFLQKSVLIARFFHSTQSVGILGKSSQLDCDISWGTKNKRDWEPSNIRLQSIQYIVINNTDSFPSESLPRLLHLICCVLLGDGQEGEESLLRLHLLHEGREEGGAAGPPPGRQPPLRLRPALLVQAVPQGEDCVGRKLFPDHRPHCFYPTA